ncbi:unnamed protein product [Mytilus coruscus]|uniref:Reverse transcriptase domain-containing protein n=1 Tax=Mytilus coruscus TaxID=42192 RepID=A0A6J8C1N3_MYTCO|nr:unnamed protein product [Mytilus coruscus]
MEKLGVISKVDEPTEWCAGMVVVPKSNGDVRICIDFTKLNESVKRENYPLPVVEESLAKLANARMFSKLDGNFSFWQTNLAEESRPLTTFITSFGKKFNLETDHKLLVPLLCSKGIAQLPPRIQRFRMRLLRFNFTIEHVPGKELNIEDALSRSPVDILSESNEFETETKAYVDSIVNNFPASDMRLQNIRDECVKDEICKIPRILQRSVARKSSLSNSLKPIGVYRESSLSLEICY